MSTPGARKSELILPEDLLQKEFDKAKLEKDKEEAGRILFEAEKKKQEELDAKLATLEIVPMFNKIILAPYPRNPYKQLVKGNIILGSAANFKNPDTGEMDTLKELVACARVVEIGPDVEYLKAGDDIFYDPRSCYPVPFMSLGHLLTSEPQILCVINEGLKERFKMNQDISS